MPAHQGRLVIVARLTTVRLLTLPVMVPSADCVMPLVHQPMVPVVLLQRVIINVMLASLGMVLSVWLLFISMYVSKALVEHDLMAQRVAGWVSLIVVRSKFTIQAPSTPEDMMSVLCRQYQHPIMLTVRILVHQSEVLVVLVLIHVILLTHLRVLSLVDRVIMTPGTVVPMLVVIITHQILAMEYVLVH
jgi:hypothetical protein